MMVLYRDAKTAGFRMTTRDYASIYFPDVEFTEADAAANRAGVLTPAQEARIAAVVQGRGRDTVKTMRWLLIWIAVLMAAGFLVEWNRTGFDTAALPSIMGLITLITLVLLGIVALTGAFSVYIGRHARARRIWAVEGTAQVLIAQQTTRQTTYMRYELRITHGRRTVKLFRLPNERSIRYFKQGERWRVYYIPYGNMDVVLSAEQVGI